jgi:hypothetical protein
MHVYPQILRVIATVCRKAACTSSRNLHDGLLQDCSPPEVVAVAYKLVGVREHLKIAAAQRQASTGKQGAAASGKLR